MNPTDRRQQEAIKALKDSAVTIRQGVITDNSPLTVAISGGSEVTGVPSLGGYEPDVDTRVNVAVWGRNALILGPASTSPSASGGIELGYAEITSNVTQTGTGSQDVSGLSVTVTVGTRPIVIEFGTGSLASSSASGITVAAIQEGATVLAGFSRVLTSTAASGTRRVRKAPSAGSHTYKIVLSQVVTGNGTLGASSTDPAYIAVYEC